MKYNLKNIAGYSIQGKDGTSGEVIDLLIDDESRIIRYIEATFKGLEPRKSGLIAHSSIQAGGCLGVNR